MSLCVSSKLIFYSAFWLDNFQSNETTDCSLQSKINKSLDRTTRQINYSILKYTHSYGTSFNSTSNILSVVYFTLSCTNYLLKKNNSHVFRLSIQSELRFRNLLGNSWLCKHAFPKKQKAISLLNKHLELKFARNVNREGDLELLLLNCHLQV